MKNEENDNFVSKRLKSLYRNYADNNFELIDILELYQINKYIKPYKSFNLNNYNKKYIIGKNNKIINKNLPSIDYIEKTISLDLSLYFTFHSSLWDFVVFKYIHDKEKIKTLINFYSENNLIQYPLNNKKILNNYSDYLNYVLVKRPLNAEVYLNSSNVLPQPYNFIKNGFMDELILKYLNIYDDNISKLNYIKDIISIRNLNPKLKNKANKIFIKLNQRLFHNNNDGIEHRIGLSVDKNPDFSQGVKIESSKINPNIYYVEITLNGKKVLNHLTYKDIMDNFIYTLNIFNKHFLINSLNKSNDNTLLDALFGDKNKNHYDYDFKASDYDKYYFYIFIIYLEFLKENGFNLESVLEWFYNNYLPEEFNVNYFDDIDIGIKLPSYFYKCNIIVTQLHKVIRTYSEYTNHPKNFNFDRSIIDISSKTPNSFTKIPSIGKKIKYIYIKNNKLNNDLKLLFSSENNSDSLNDISVNILGKKYDQLLLQNKDCVRDMIKYDVLDIKRGIVSIKSPRKFLLLGYSFVNGVIPYYWIADNKSKVMINKMISDGDAVGYSTLVDKKEANYFDYFLSNVFENGQGIRNKYAHGAANSLTESQHRENYLRVLFIFFLLSVKINEEFDYYTNFKKYKNYSIGLSNIDLLNLIKFSTTC